MNSILSPRCDYQLDTIESCRADGIEDLLRRHKNEIAHYQDIPLDVDWQRYEDAEKAGVFRVMTARLGSKIIGYVCFFVMPHAHYKGSLTAVQDVLYVDPDYRHGRTGYRLIQLADDYLRAEGVQITMHHYKVTHPIGSLLMRQGYQLIDFVAGKRLDWPGGRRPENY